MFLAFVEDKYPNELRADFQEYYSLNLDHMGALGGFSHSHAAVLVTQLPKTSRVFCAIEPNNTWTDSDMYLAHIEYDLRVLIWQKTKDGSRGINQPKPPKTPKERAKDIERKSHINKNLVNEVLGFKGVSNG